MLTADLSEIPNDSHNWSHENIQEHLKDKTEQAVLDEVIILLSSHKINVHDDTRILLFRHFVDALVRVAYLKYGGSKNFSRNVERVFVNRIISFFEGKRKRALSQEEEV